MSDDSTYVTVDALRSALADLPGSALVVIETAEDGRVLMAFVPGYNLPETWMRIARTFHFDGVSLRVSDTPEGRAA